MGTRMKKSIFDEQTSKALKKWHMAVKKKQGGKGSKSPTVTLGGSSTVSKGSSGRTLHRFKTTGHSTRGAGFEDNDTSDMETDSLSPTSSTTSLIIKVDHHDEEETETNKTHPGDQETGRGEDDFSFNPAQQKEP